MKYTAPVDSTLFLLKDVLGFDNEMTEPVLREAAKLCEEVIAPTNQEGDRLGCKKIFQVGPTERVDTVEVPKCFHESWKKFTEGGWLGLSVPEQYGGQGLPYALASAINEYVSSSNMAFSLYPGLTRGAIQALLEVATEEQKQFYIPKMASGEWTGTMNLTEPHCGTDLGLIKTKAAPVGVEEQCYYITGQKIFISCGEHDLADNIVHLVLARIEGDPEGTKGISLFIVPKLLTDGDRNRVSCGSIEKKMGIHGSSTCVMNYDEAVGYLVGERGKGLNAMFIMMNEARLGVAVQGLSQSELAYQNALNYAKERVQSVKLTDPKGGSVAIINHPDVRRMLLDIKSVVIPSRLLVLEAALLVQDKSQAAQDKLGLLTPILKAMLTDYAVEHALKAQQVFGGHGYVRDWGMEQIVRDARITMIYEGTNGVQALDLVARKLPKDMGRAVFSFFKETTELFTNLTEEENQKVWKEYGIPVSSAVSNLKTATEWLAANGMKNPNDAGSASYDYLKMFGLAMMGIAWIKILRSTEDEDRHNTALYFMERILPETSFLLARIKAGSDTMMNAEF